MQVYIRPKEILLGSSLTFNLKEDPVRCAKVCDKSWVILMYRAVIIRSTCNIYSIKVDSKMSVKSWQDNGP